ncbi:hypothetical protein GQ600_14165 [Phytophthora cactorum]|nr:hypothetical protein GQ600_14165 [Phytophthora cactorum]
MTLLKHGLTRYEEILMPEEMDIISEVYDRVVSYSEVVLVGEPPNWFLSSNDLVCDSKSSSTWTMFGYWARVILVRCHSSYTKQRNLLFQTESWEPLLGWALGLQYLHEHELAYKTFDDTRLLARHHATASGVLSGLGLIPIKRRPSISLHNLGCDSFSRSENGDSVMRRPRAANWDESSDIFAFGMSIYNTRKWASMYSDEEVLVLPKGRPLFLTDQEWNLIQEMCSTASSKRVNMVHVVHRLQACVKTAFTESNAFFLRDLDIRVIFHPGEVIALLCRD